MPIETTRPDKRLVERFGEIGRANQNYAFGLRKAIKLHQQLVER